MLNLVESANYMKEKQTYYKGKQQFKNVMLNLHAQFAL